MSELKQAGEMLAKCVALAEEKKARDIVSLDLNGLTLISDYFLIVSANNARQAQALCDHIELGMKADGCPPLRIEGYRDGKWILMDFSVVVVHIFQDDERTFYDLERLWGDAKRVDY